MIDYINELNEEQLKVVQNGDGACLVLAGAGSGKTRTITYRVAHLIEQGVDPKNILLVTFTNKAAKEMINRVQELSGGKVRLPWSGTFHHVSYRILKKYAPLLNYKSNFSILDSADSVDLIKICLKQEGVDRKQRRFPSAKVVQSIISYARNAGETIEQVLELKHPKWSDLNDVLSRIADDYRIRKLSANVMDFDDLLVNLYLLLLKSERVRDAYATQFQYVLVDEYQDTNRVQASIIRLMAGKHKNILVVGDDAQSIYSFRAADIKNILAFSAKGGSAFGGEGYPDAKIFKLETNYRSTPDILNLANDVIANNIKQYDKDLKSILNPFTKPEVLPFSDNYEEAEFIAERILELREEGVPLKEISVLFRASFHSQALEVELVKRDIPYDYRGGVRFFERAHIKDVLAYLRVFNNKDDVIAWSRVLNMQVGIGPSGAQKLIQAIALADTTEELSQFGSMLSSRGQMGWNDFMSVWKKMLLVEKIPSELIKAVLDSKYTEYLEYEYQDYRERLQDLLQLSVFSERQSDLPRFLAEASMQESYNTSQSERGSDDEKIILSTVHQAKGLEWQAVFILNLSAGQFPNDRALSEADGVEEERRLFYVALTRAKKYLYLTYPLSGGFNSLNSGPSMFLEEINRDLISESGFIASTVFTPSEQSDFSGWDDPSDDVDDIVYEAVDEGGPRSFLRGIDEL
ncbi:ATP-dependent helicase [Patescibacteria group bacterium]|nr:ATP-dependent helicase [Patescibacteria group bacterium]MBU1895661.1 ATP-dependent helicase [Patescibacteria group bacterium]